MMKWEYNTIEFYPEGKWMKLIKLDSVEVVAKINKLGQEGWELVNAVDYAIGGTTQKIVMFFKRPIKG